MLRLKSHNTSPPSGFCILDKATGFKAHGWSIRAVAAQWYHERLKRGHNCTVQDCCNDVENYTAQELMKLPNWKDWVMVVDTPKFIPRPVPLQPVQARISVVIPAYDSEPRMMRVIESVRNQVSDIHILVGNHLQPKFDSEIVKEDKKIQIHYDSKDLGFGAKCNLGSKKSTGQFLWFLNDDCYPNSNCASKMMEVMNANPKIAIVGHILRYPDGRIQHGGTHRVKGQVGFPHLDLEKQEPSLKEPTEMEAVTAASMLVRRQAFEEVGGFDESYFLYLEDSDLCLKVREKGWKVVYTPFCEAIHEEHASSRLRTDLDRIVKDSTAIFQRKWKHYFEQDPPVFESFDKLKSEVKIDAVYVHLVGNPESEALARRFVDSVNKCPPGQDLNWIIACNSPAGNQLSSEMKSVFSQLGRVSYFPHDNSGWDIGAFQAYARTSVADLCLFFGASAYCRQQNWAHFITESFRIGGPESLFGTCGNLGDPNTRVSPHIRTTGFWCSPKIINDYPHITKTKEQRYPFEHGPNCLTLWCWSQGYQVYLVTTDSVLAYPDWDNPPNGFHRGDQRELIFGDRITEPPYYSHP
jgi:GT2 family glycosyltransferase